MPCAGAANSGTEDGKKNTKPQQFRLPPLFRAQNAP
jgi:hypothetical protein